MVQQSGTSRMGRCRYVPDANCNVKALEIVYDLDMPLERKVPIEYFDGVYDPSGFDRPNVMVISNLTFDGFTGRGSMRRTALFTFYGMKPYQF